MIFRFLSASVTDRLMNSGSCKNIDLPAKEAIQFKEILTSGVEIIEQLIKSKKIIRNHKKIKASHMKSCEVSLES